MSMVRVHILVQGSVQGVFFRQTMRDVAERLGATGWVKNLPDGRVEAVAEGEKGKIEELISWCRKGPPMSKVSKVDATFEPYTGEYSVYKIIR